MYKRFVSLAYIVFFFLVCIPPFYSLLFRFPLFTFIYTVALAPSVPNVSFSRFFFTFVVVAVVAHFNAHSAQSLCSASLFAFFLPVGLRICCYYFFLSNFNCRFSFFAF